MDAASIAAYCAVPQTDCKGWCPDDEIGGVPARVATYVIVTVSGLSIVAIKNLSDKRFLYWFQYTIFFILTISSLVFGGMLRNKTLSAYHALLAAYLSFGANITITVTFYTLLFSQRALDLIIFVLSNLLFNVTCGLLVIKLTVIKSSRKIFGSQAACNSRLNLAPWRSSKIPDHFVFVILVGMPWLTGVIYSVAMKKSRSSSVAAEPSVKQKSILFILFGMVYGIWITATEFYVKSQELPFLGGTDRTIKPSQIPIITLAVISILFPIRSLVQHIRKDDSYAHTRLPTRDTENPDHDNQDYTPSRTHSPLQPQRNTADQGHSRTGLGAQWRSYDRAPTDASQPAGLMSVTRDYEMQDPVPPAYVSLPLMRYTEEGSDRELSSVSSRSTLRASVIDGSKAGVDKGSW